MFKYQDQHTCVTYISDWYRWFLRIMFLVWIALIYRLYTQLPS